MVSVPDQIDTIKRALGYTDAQIAQKCSVSEQSVQNWRAGSIPRRKKQSLIDHLYQRALDAERFDVHDVERMRQRMIGILQSAPREAITELYSQVMSTCTEALMDEFMPPTAQSATVSPEEEARQTVADADAQFDQQGNLDSDHQNSEPPGQDDTGTGGS